MIPARSLAGVAETNMNTHNFFPELGEMEILLFSFHKYHESYIRARG